MFIGHIKLKMYLVLIENHIIKDMDLVLCQEKVQIKMRRLC